jgi:hypothetical protein
MAQGRKRRRGKLLAFLIPMGLLAAIFAWVADHPLYAAGIGALIGFFIGLALIAFPNLDRGGPADTDSWLR